MKIVVTGGHLAPALALLDVLRKDKVSVIGRKHPLEGDRSVSLEYHEIKRRGVEFFSIKAGRLQRRVTSHTVASLLRFPIGVVAAIKILKRVRPHIVVSFGGYVSFPVTMAAWVLSIPVVVHEQTLGAGLANRLTSLFAKKVCISWESSRKFFPKNKTVFTGNPIRNLRPSTFDLQLSKEDLPLIYITGGSTGSHAINWLVAGCLVKLLAKYRVVHQTGNAKQYQDFDHLTKLRGLLRKDLSHRYLVVKFVEPSQVGTVLAASDLVVSRAGINTVTELLFFEKQVLLIPLPHGQHNEQQTNARFLEKLGLAKVLKQDRFTERMFLEQIDWMVRHRLRYRKRGLTKVVHDAGLRILSVVKREAKPPLYK